MISRRSVLAAGVVSAGAALLGGCARGDDLLAAGRRAGFLRLGIANEQPFGFMTDEARPTGQSVEVARAVLAGLGVDEVEGVVTDFTGLIPGLLGGAFDVIAAGIVVTRDRCAQVRFSDPVNCLRQGFAVRAEDDRELGSYEAVVAAGDLRVGVLAGSVEEGDLAALGLPPVRVLALPDLESLRVALLGGVVDVVALSSVAVRWMARDPGSRMRVAGVFAVPGGDERFSAFAFRPTDAALAVPFGRDLRRLLRDGTVAELSEPFGFTADEIRPAIGRSVREVCGA
ncbi:transporter substrate-binding domain-containing protein [Cellulomonas cellasea]|uniref:Polar amino acid transport system substrate-binding protein n=1 Tax=Cellulomonas cellasea TaxID=43670 RepID=A0A7W4UFC2_9CELL|nr:transporter substrate-binding domain-containing protein [Cellulomonas cellasea]MBB2923136.1 polar amino acid transport system substrate-binding protein [Cellulomonas cellasea]